MPKLSASWQKASADLVAKVPSLKSSLAKSNLSTELDVLDNYIYWLGKVKEIALQRVELEKELQKGSSMHQLGAAGELQDLTKNLDSAGKEAISAGRSMKKAADSISAKLDKLGDAINAVDRDTISAPGKAAITALVQLGVKLAKTARDMNLDSPENWVAEIKQNPTAGRAPTGGGG